MESNFIISKGDTVNKYFHLYPSLVANGSTPVSVGSTKDLNGLIDPVEPLSIQI